MSEEGDSTKIVSNNAEEKMDTDEKNSKESSKESEDVKNSTKDAENNIEKDSTSVEDSTCVEEKGESKPTKDKLDSKENSNDSSKKDEPEEKPKENDVKDEKTPLKSKKKEAPVKAKDKKKETKKVVEEESEDEEEEEENEDIEGEDEAEEKKEKGVPLLDRPLEMAGKRERKNVQRFTEEDNKGRDSPKLTDAINGSGTALGEIPRIEASISRFKGDDLKILHRLLFKSVGKTTLVKKNIKAFNGFDFKKDSEEYTKKIAAALKYDTKQLKSICEMLELVKTDTKEAIATRIVDFLLEPKDTAKPSTGGRPKRTAAVKANNRGYSSHDDYSSDDKPKSRITRDKGKRPSLKEESSSEDTEEEFNPSDEDGEERPRVKKRQRTGKKKPKSDEEDVSDLEASPSSETDEDEPKSKRRKVIKPNNKSKAKGTPGRRGRKPAPVKKTPGRKKKKETSSEEESDVKDSGSSSEDEPLSKKVKNSQPPTDDDIKNYVKEILEGANLEEITMKTVCQQVYAHYPDFDLAHKKDFIKTTVKSLISAS